MKILLATLCITATAVAQDVTVNLNVSGGDILSPQIYEQLAVIVAQANKQEAALNVQRAAESARFQQSINYYNNRINRNLDDINALYRYIITNPYNGNH